MSDDIELKNGIWSFVHSVDSGPAWHNKGREAADNATPTEWRTAAGHDFTVSKRPLFFRDNAGNLRAYQDRFAMVRDDNEHELGIGSGIYKIVQPAVIDDLCDKVASYDERLRRASSFTLRQGDLICSAYKYQGDLTVGGAAHHAYLMASTSFDGSSSSLFWISIIQAVCANTIAAGLGESDAIVRVRHSAKLDPVRVIEQLAELAQQVTRYKALGDSLARANVSAQEIAFFIRDVLDIPRDASADDVSTKKKNQRQAIIDAMQISANERAQTKATGYDAFTLLQGITRYVDHERAVRDTANGDDNVARFDSANFGSGQAMKIRAVNLLQDLVKDRVAA